MPAGPQGKFFVEICRYIPMGTISAKNEVLGRFSTNFLAYLNPKWVNFGYFNSL
jgi:hypothetical protein